MIPINSLEGKVSKLERQRNSRICFELVKEPWPGDDHFAECDFVLKRNGEPRFRFPRKLSVAEWESKYS